MGWAKSSRFRQGDCDNACESSTTKPQPSGAKNGERLDVQTCFGDVLRGVLRGWEGKKELALALDASTLGERFTVLNISVMYRGCGIPVTWKIIPAMEEGEWRTYWEGMLETLAGIVPQDWKVIVMA